MLSRRDFTKLSTLTAATAVVSGKTFSETTTSAPTNASTDDLLVGACSWTFGIDDHEAMMKAASECGLNAIQFNGQPYDVPVSELKATADKHGLTIVCADPFDTEPPSEQEATVENAMALFNRAIDYAAELGTPTAIHGLTRWTIAQKTDEQKWQRLAELCNKSIAYAKEKHVPLMFEPCNLYEIPLVHSTKDFEKLLSMLDDPGYLQYLPDSFHLNIHEIDPKAVLKKYASRTAMFHISDSNRAGIGKGRLDFHSYHDALRNGGFRGPAIMEIVLTSTPVNVPPRNDAELAEFKKQVAYSATKWREYAKVYG